MLIKILFYNNKNYSKKYLWSNKNFFIGIECFLHRKFFIFLFIYICIIIYIIIIIFIYLYIIIIILNYIILYIIILTISELMTFLGAHTLFSYS